MDSYYSGFLAVVAIFSGFRAIRFLAGCLHARYILKKIPGPSPSSYIWGEEWELYHRSPGTLYSLWHKQYGPIVKYSGAFGRQVVSITDPCAISFVLLEKTYDFPKARGVRAWFDATIGKGILWVEGKAAHEKQRRLVAPPLSAQSIRSFLPMLHDTSSKLAAKFAEMLEQSAHDEVEIEVTNWAGRFALDAVCRAVFSYDFDCLSGRQDCVSETLDQLTNNEHLLSSFYMRALFWVFPPVLSIGKKGKLIRETKQQLGETASAMWKDAKIAGDNSGKSLMAHLLKVVEADKTNISEEELVSQMRSIISAGYEPISSILAWILYELAVNQNVQDDLRDEVSTLHNNTMEHLNSLPLLDAVIREALRLHPPIIENHHEAGKTLSVPLTATLAGTRDTHIIIPEGTLLSIPLSVVHRDSRLWGSDADNFQPSRWINQDSGSERRLLSFSEGPRGCLGRTFAMLELKVVVTTLVSQFRFFCNTDIEEFQSFVIRPRVKGQTTSALPLLVRRA